MTQETDWTRLQAGYWNAFNELARNAAAQQTAAAPATAAPWQEGMQQWSRLFANQPNAQSDVVERMLSSAKSYLATMQATLGSAFGAGTAPPAGDPGANGAAWLDGLRQALAMPAFGGAGMAPGAPAAGFPGAGAFAGMGGMPGFATMPGMGGIPGMGNVPGMNGMPGMGAGLDASLRNNPLARALKDIAGQGARGFEQMASQLEPYIEAAKNESSAMLNLPAFGEHREKQERLNKLIAAWGDYRSADARYNAELAKSSQRGLAILEDKLAARAEPGRQIDSMRGLYDLWVDSAEEAYAEAAMREEFRGIYGDMVNTQMRVRALVQEEFERTARELGMPTRSELNSVEKRLHELRRELRRAAEAREEAGADLHADAAGDRPAPAAARGSRSGANASKTRRPAAATRTPAKPQSKGKERGNLAARAGVAPASKRAAPVAAAAPQPITEDVAVALEDSGRTVEAIAPTTITTSRPKRSAAKRAAPGNGRTNGKANGKTNGNGVKHLPSRQADTSRAAVRSAASVARAKPAATQVKPPAKPSNGHATNAGNGAALAHKPAGKSFAASLSSARAVIARRAAAKDKTRRAATAKRR